MDSLDSILFRCSTLRERLSHLSPSAEAISGDDRTLTQWQRAYSPGDPEALHRRLSWDRIEPEQVSSLRHLRVRPSGDWIAILEDALRRAPQSAAEARPDPVPFEELWRPFVEAGRDRIPDELIPSVTGRETLEADLFRRLAVVGAAAIQEQFEATLSDNVRNHYAAFVTEQLANRLPVLHDLPVLARALSEITAHWISATSELLGRLREDRHLLENRFGTSGTVVSFTPGLSDPHQGGRTVTRVSFENGRSVAWKPRDVSITSGAHRLFRWLSDNGLACAPPSLTIVEGEGYGWIEWVESEELQSAEAVELYYRRAGSLLLLAHLLNGRDLHMENIIASREGPVLIDAEALMQPETEVRNVSTALDSIGAEISSSVISTGLLSFPQTDSEGRGWDISGLRGAAGYRSSFRSTIWTEINTDQMRRVVTSSEAQSSSNIPEYQGHPAELQEWIESVVEGFERTWCFIQSRRDEWLELIEHTMRGPVRLVLRPTNLYAILLSQLAEPRNLKDAINGDLLIDSLNRVFASSRVKPTLWPMIADEARELRAFDVPLFIIDADSTTLEAPGGRVMIASRSGLDVVQERLARMSEDEIQRQIALILATVPRKGNLIDSGATPLDEKAAMTVAEIESEVEAIALKICRGAIRGSEGDVNWRLAGHLRTGGENGDGGGWYLYEGVAGVALFLAAAGRHFENDEFRELSRIAMGPVERLSRNEQLRAVIRKEPVGVQNGIGSLIYSLALMSRFLDEPRWAVSAASFASVLSRDSLREDHRIDVEGGLAGTALALAALNEVAPSPAWEERIVWCADLLLSGRSGEAWTTGGGDRLTGFAHGSAGIATALETAALLSGESRFLNEAARIRQLLADMLSEEGWPHDHNGAGPVMNALCHGAVGIASSMMRRPRPLHDPRLAIRALGVVVRDGFHPVDHLCCGNAGRLDFYVQCRMAVDPGDEEALALRLAGQMIERRRSDGRWKIDDPAGEEASFFRGLSGIGYSLLRVVQPKFPSVASFEIWGGPSV